MTHMKIAVKRMKLEVRAKLKEMEDMMKPIAPFFSEKLRRWIKKLNIRKKS